MKKTILTTAALAMILGLNGCTPEEQAAMEQGMRDAQRTQDMQQMERECKNYVASKFPKLPMAAISVSPGYTKGNGKTIIPVRMKWDEPRVDETGKCVLRDGRVRKYKANY